MSNGDGQIPSSDLTGPGILVPNTSGELPLGMVDPIATPSFSGAPIPGVPGPQQKAQGMLQQLAQLAARKRLAAPGPPAAIPGGGDPNAARQIGMNTANPHAWGFQRFAAGLGANIKNAVAKEKETQLLKAEGDWTYLQNSMNELFDAQQNGDQNTAAAAQKKIDTVLGDQKKLKNMAKALNQDWLNPEKTTVYGEALKRVMKNQKQQDAQNQQKQSAAQGLKEMFKKLIGQRQQPQLSDEEKKAMAKEIQDKAPIATPPPLDITMLKDMAQYERAIAEARDKYTYIPSSDGTVWAVNKSDRTDAHQLRDAETGTAIKGKKPANEGRVYALNGVPMGVYHNGEPIYPTDPTWTERDQGVFETAVNGAKEKQFLKLDPIIASQIGDPPDPKNFPKGRSDSGYQQALKAYGKEAEGIKNRMAAAGGATRAMVWNEYRPVQALDADGNLIWTYAKNAIGEGMSPAGEGVKAKSKQAQIKDIEVASDNYKDSVKNLDKPFTAEQVAKLTMALRTGDDELARTLFNTVATQHLTEAQQDFVVWAGQINERAMSLRNIAGMGQGAQDLRDAIRMTIGSAQSGSKEMLLKRAAAFDNQVALLKTGIPHPGKPKAEAPASKGNVIVVSPDDMK